MTVWFLAFLAVAWIVVYLPSVWRAKQESPLPAVQRFKRGMRMIAPRSRTGRWIVVPEAREKLAEQSFLRAQERRKRVLIALVSVAAASGVWALAKGGYAVEIHLIVDAFVAFYVALMLDANRRRTERQTKVRTLQPRPTSHVAPMSDGEPTFEILEAGGGSGS